MTAHGRSFNFIQHVHSMEIPFFQRSYVWDVENWESFIDDVLSDKRGHFFGSLIFKPYYQATGDEKRRVSVIDGQQRLTTFGILVKALSDSISPGEVLSKAENLLFYRPSEFSSEKIIRLKHSHLDHDAYEEVMFGTPEVLMSLKRKSNIVECYKYFFKRFAEIALPIKQRLYDKLTQDGRDVWVVIDLKEGDSEQEIFDTINSAGIRLSYADIIKNAIFQELMQKAGTDPESENRVVDIYRKFWAAVFEKDEEAREYWLHEAQSVRVKRTNIELFLHAYAIVKKFYNPKEDSLEDLPDIYKNQISKLPYELLCEFIRDIGDAATTYRKCILVFDAAHQFEYENYAERLFQILDKCNVTTFHPYILHLYRRYADNEEMLKKRMRELEKFVMRQYVVGVSARQYNTYCAEFIDDEERVNVRNAETSEDDVRAALKNMRNNHRAALVLFWIELHRRINPCFDDKGYKYAFSLEHILPQQWFKNTVWSALPVLDDGGNPILDEAKAKEYRTAKCYEIGNMTLLTTSLNSSVSNSEYAVKMEGDQSGKGRKKKGVRDYAGLTITCEDLVKPYDSGDKQWDEAHISKRTKMLSDEFISIWG